MTPLPPAGFATGNYHYLAYLGLCAWLATGGGFSAHAAEAKADDFLQQAQDAHRKGEGAQAVTLVSKALAADPKNAKAWFFRAGLHATANRHELAVADYGEVLKLQPQSAETWQQRGVEHFKLGRFAESVADFDQFIELRPAQAPHHWQRGISLYYAGRYEDGRKQFESHQTVNPNDVENAVWHYLCVARSSGVEKARTALIPIKDDRRVPMMQVHALFAGKAKPEDVLTAAQAGGPTAARLNDQVFYAHLYLGLYYEAASDERRAREHIFKAADDFKAEHYMGDVARVHAAWLRKKK